MSNRLAREQSPYLLQHANNPVDWYAWGDEAFAKARSEDKPIFLSIGYSTCHWCHVMEHESFEDAGVAALLNEHFVAIKVDREERPDVDRVYMAFVQATTGAGGWPMSVWLTPELQPFYGGTYFPPTSRWGRPGFAEILRELARVWREERGRVVETASALTQRLREAVTADGASEAEEEPEEQAGELARQQARKHTEEQVGEGAALPPVAHVEALADALDGFRHSFDPRHGGFGGAPKFPRPSELHFLLREHARSGEADARMLAVDTLRAMALGGMRDHVGGGFHRYSVDAAWRVPHFEKMLYDQAQLALVYLDAAQVTGESFYAAVAEDTLAYVQREMTHADGGFFSAEDADSVPPEHASPQSAGEQAGGESVAASRAKATEGAFYLWSTSEVEALLGADADIVKLRFGMLPEGNAPEDPHGEFTGKNVLYTAHAMPEIAERVERDVDQVVRVLRAARVRLFKARGTRPRPHLDDKVLTAWNGLMIAAFARAARVLEAQAESTVAGYLRTAERAARFIERELWDASTGRLRRRWRAGDAAIDGYSEDYASLTWGLLELFQASGDPHWLEWALAVQRQLDARFADPREGGWFNTTGEDTSVLLRMKEEYDGAEPAASSIALQNLLTLAHLTNDPQAPRTIQRTLGRFGERIGSAARAIPFMMSNLTAWHAGHTQIAIVGPRDRADTLALRRTLAGQFLPFAVIVPIEPGERQDQLAALLPWTRALVMQDEKATAYVCRNFTCDRPVTTADDLAALLQGSAASA